MQITSAEYCAIERELCKRSLAAFAKRAWHVLEPATDLKWDWALDAICLHLEAVTDGRIKRLLMNVPPGSMKSLLTSVIWPAWEWGPQNMPAMRFVSTAHEETLAIRDSRRCRDLIKSEWYQALWPIQLANDLDGKREFGNTSKGIRQARSFQSMTGVRGDRIILDDPISADNANSAAKLEAARIAFTETLPTRVNNDTSAIIVIMQRLHEKDLSGWLLNGGNGEQWENICLPAIQDDGGALWEQKHSIDELLRMREAAPHMFAGQYQQAPAPAEGNIFKPDKINVIEAVPNGTVFVRAWDLAATLPKHGNDPDYTVGAKVGVMPDGRYLVSDIVRLRGAPEDVEAAIVNTAKRDGIACRIKLPQDPGQAGKSQVAYLTKQLSGFAVISAVVSGDKTTRAEPFASQTNVGNVCMLQASWNDAMIDEMRMFPNGAHDDQVDALSDAFALVSNKTFNIKNLI